MITVFDFLNAGGKCKTACGWDFKICWLNKESDYPICGYVVYSNNDQMMYKFDVNGFPEKLPITHGLNLIPVVPITTYRMIDMKKMDNFDKVQDLIKSEIERISEGE